MKILVINGPNMNMLGIREPEIYGTLTYAGLIEMIEAHAREKGVEVKCFQSNHEGDIVDEIQSAYGVFDGIVINPAAFTHTSVAIHDALKAVALEAVEVHVSNIEAREDFRKINFIRDCCFAEIAGRGAKGYLDAFDMLVERLEYENKN